MAPPAQRPAQLALHSQPRAALRPESADVATRSRAGEQASLSPAPMLISTWPSQRMPACLRRAASKPGASLSAKSCSSTSLYWQSSGRLHQNDQRPSPAWALWVIASSTSLCCFGHACLSVIIEACLVSARRGGAGSCAGAAHWLTSSSHR